jgi:hypothetical protein
VNFSAKIQNFEPPFLISPKLPSAKESPKKNSGRWLIRKVKTIEVGFRGRRCQAGCPLNFSDYKKVFYWPPSQDIYGAP